MRVIKIMKKYLPVMIAAVTAVMLIFLMQTYPMAAVLLPVFLLYMALSIVLHICEQRLVCGAGAAETGIFTPMHVSEKVSLLCLFLTAVSGLLSDLDSWFRFQLLYAADILATAVDLILRLKELLLRKLRPDRKKKFRGHSVIHSLAVTAVIVLFYLLGTFLPYAFQPQVSESTVADFDVADFYSDEDCGERAKVISDNGEALEERIRMISQAEEEIILSTFEFDADTSGKMMLAALMAAAERGVTVSILVDGFPYLASMWGNPYFLALIQTENVEVKVYNPVRLWAPWDYLGRMHDKYLIVDDTGYLLGGRNTYDYFLGDQEGHKNYDWDVLVYSAEAGSDSSLTDVREYFVSVWEMDDCKLQKSSLFWDSNPAVQAASEELQALYVSMTEEYADWFVPVDYETITVPVNNIALVSNPVQTSIKEPVVFYTITELMMQAEESVTFHTPYIICNEWMTKRLTELCDAVGDVTMMTNSVANNGNPFGSADYYRHKEEILETGVQILEYDGGISYHGKCFVIDDRLSSIGSFNWDMRSVYIDTELMLVIDSEELNLQLREEMENYEADALTVIDSETSIPPEDKEARKVSETKQAFIHFLLLFEWARFAI